MFVNTDKFRQAAITFQKIGKYTSDPPKTSGYRDFWDKEIDRCLNGFYAEDGDYITGYHYFYLNYCPILLVKEKEVTLPSGAKKKVGYRERDFPRFWDSDYQFFRAVEDAEHNGKHLCVLKTRGRGYSYKAAAMLCRNYFLVPESKSYAVAAENEFLIKDGLLSKSWEMMSFVDDHTAWSKKRQKMDTKMHKRASMIIDRDGVKTELGYQSEIIGITVKNDVQKIRGKRGKLMLFEEAGKFPKLKDAWNIALSSMQQGELTYGLMLAFGTGGTEGADYEGLKELFYYPDGYNILPFDNVWDEGATKQCGLFIPEYMNLEGHMDEDGNSLLHSAKAYALAERKKVEENSNDKASIDRYIAEKPFTPAEATLQISSNIFPKKDLMVHMSHIMTNSKLYNYKQVGELYFDESGVVKWKQSNKAKDIVEFPLDKTHSKKGAVVIWEHPPDEIPYGLYVAGCDPYDHDESTTTSLGSCFIYKRFQNFESYYDIIVAEYTGRPDTANEFYENVRLLLLYYRASLLYENQNKGLFQYFTTKHCEHLLADQPSIIDDIIKDSSVQRRKCIHMNTAIKEWAERETRDWLNEEYEPGKKNLTKILSIPLIQELISYNDKGNFDRVIALFMVMIYKKELHKVNVKKKDRESKKDPFFTSPLFKYYN